MLLLDYPPDADQAAAGKLLIGVNTRNLRTLEVDNEQARPSFVTAARRALRGREWSALGRRCGRGGGAGAIASRSSARR